MKRLLYLLMMVVFLAIPASAHAKKTIDMGQFKITAYCPCDYCSEGYGRLTSTRKYARSNHTIAVDPSIISYGSKVKIGDKTYVAEDCGGLVKGDHIDIFFDTHDEVREFGTRYSNVWIIR